MEIADITSLAPLAVLACPIGMGAMMWMMMRGNKQRTPSNQQAAQPPSLELLREEQDRLSQQINQLERRQADNLEADPQL